MCLLVWSFGASPGDRQDRQAHPPGYRRTMQNFRSSVCRLLLVFMTKSRGISGYPTCTAVKTAVKTSDSRQMEEINIPRHAIRPDRFWPYEAYTYGF